MRKLLFCCALAVLAFPLFSSRSLGAQERAENSLFAQSYDDDSYDDYGSSSSRRKTITCESRSGRYNYCRTETRGNVRLERQLSDTPCREYYTWGADGDGSGVWVADGCRGVFVVEARRRRSHPGGGRQAITCESRRGRYNYCQTGTRGNVRLERQLSDTLCREYYTWGADGDGSGVWVADGCRGIFVVEARRPPHGGGSGGGRRTITCKSTHFSYNHCEVNQRGRVQLERQLSSTRCIQGDNWGVDRRGIWVDRGCAGEFVIE